MLQKSFTADGNAFKNGAKGVLTWETRSAADGSFGGGNGILLFAMPAMCLCDLPFCCLRSASSSYSFWMVEEWSCGSLRADFTAAIDGPRGTAWADGRTRRDDLVRLDDFFLDAWDFGLGMR